MSYTFVEVFLAPVDDQRELLYQYVESFAGVRNIADEDLDLLELTARFLHDPLYEEENKDEFLLLVLTVAQRMQLIDANESEAILSDSRFQKLLVTPREDLLRKKTDGHFSYAELIWQAYTNAEEAIPRDSLTMLIPLISNGHTLLSLAQTARWIRQFINQPTALAIVKKHVLLDETNVAVKETLQDSDDFVHWYENNFLTENCTVYNGSADCANKALLNANFTYIRQAGLHPTVGALREFKQNLEKILLLHDDQEELALFIAYLLQTGDLQVRLQAFSLLAPLLRYFSHNYRYSTDFLQTIVGQLPDNHNLRTRLINSTLPLLTQKKSDMTALEIQLSSLINVFAQEQVLAELKKDLLSAEGRLPPVSSLKILRKLVSSFAWKKLKQGLLVKAKNLRGDIQRVQRKHVKTAQDKLFMAQISEVENLLAYLEKEN